MPSQPTDVLLAAIAERAKASEDVRRNAIGWMANTSLTEREFQVLEIDDYLAFEGEVFFLVAKRLRSDGEREAQLGWARPFCPDCGKDGILQPENREEGIWSIACCEAKVEGSPREVCTTWLGRLAVHPLRDRFPQRRLESGDFRPGGGTDWEGAYQKDTTPWDHGAMHPEIGRLFEELSIEGGRILLPGCGRGHDAAGIAQILAAREGQPAKWSVTGLDLSSTALAAALDQYPQHRVEWVQGDLFALSRIWENQFDLVVEHTCISGLPPSMRDEYVTAVTRFLKKGGTYLGIFLVDTGQPPAVGPPFAFPKEEIRERFSSEFDIVRLAPPELSYPDRDSGEVSLLARPLTESDEEE